MGLTGTLKDGTRITTIPLCEFEASGLDSQGEVGPCGEVSRYRVVFQPGEVLHACEEHAQYLWDTDSPTIVCDNCEKVVPFTQIAPILGIYTPNKTYTVCSYTCMTELGWKLREDQPKLSKSRTEQSEV